MNLTSSTRCLAPTPGVAPAREHAQVACTSRPLWHRQKLFFSTSTTLLFTCQYFTSGGLLGTVRLEAHPVLLVAHGHKSLDNPALRMKYTRWLLFGAFLTLTSTCSGQRGSAWRVYKAADGLPETLTTAVTIGPHGHLWVRHSAVEWVGWLDGYEIKAIPSPSVGNSRVYERPHRPALDFQCRRPRSIQKADTEWLQYPSPEITAEFHKNNLSAVRPLPLVPFKQNHVLLLFPDSLMDCNVENHDRPQLTLIRAADKTGLQKFSNLAPARDGGLWVTGAKGLAKLPAPLRNLKPETQWQEHLLPDHLLVRNLREPVEDDAGGVTALAESSDAGQQVIAHFDGTQWIALPVVGEKLTQAWREGDIYWAMTLNSLYQIKAGQKQLVPDEEISVHHYFDAAFETNGIFWLATSDGLFRHAPLIWRAPADEPEPNAPILAVAQDATNRLWVASATALYRLQNDVWTNYPFPAWSLDDLRETRALFPLANGLVAFQAGERLIEFNPGNGQFISAGANAGTEFKPLGLLRDGSLCVQHLADIGGTLGELAQYDGAHISSFPFTQPDSATRSNLLFIFVSSNEDLWLSGNNGLIWFHDKKWQTFPSSPQTVSSAPTCMLDAGDGKIWFGIQDKIMQFDGKTWTAVHAGFFHVNALLKARDGSIYVASDNGLHRFSHGTWSANSLEEGLPSATVRQVFQDVTNRIWAGTARGLSLYHPDADTDPPRTYIQNLPNPNNTAPEGSIITISFSAQDKWKYTAADRLVYSYRLDGLEWSPYQEQRTASFLDLSAGKHLFRVRSMDRNWNVDPRPALLEFTIAVPWYRESRLMFISGLGLAAVIFFAGLAFNRHRQLLLSHAAVEAKVALRTQQLERANQELFHSQKMNALGTLAAGIAHDFNNILSIIKGSAQIIEDNLGNEDKITTRTGRIKTVVEQGAGIVQAMLGFSRNSDRQLAPCEVSATIRDTITLLGDRFLREVEVNFTPAVPAPPEVPASRDFLQQILLNFIFNAAEASTGHRQIILSAALVTELPASLALKPAVAAAYVLISVKDFGGGIAPEIMPRIFEPFFTTKSLSVRRGTGLGLSMVYELARQMDCGLAVASAVGQGSTFTLIIPVRDLPVEPPPKK